MFEKQIQTLLRVIIRHRHAGPFIEPVNPERDGCPDYLAVIKSPMDLSTVRRRLDAHQLHTVGDFVSALKLVRCMRLLSGGGG